MTVSSYKKLQLLALHLDNMREIERGRIARELHDEMGATLTVLKMRLHWLAAKLPAELVHLSTETAQMNTLVSDAIHTLRHVVNQLIPSQLHHSGLAAAVQSHVLDFQQRTGIKCTLNLPEDELPLTETQSATLFRIVQESLNNVAKHARASQVKIHFSENDDTLLLLVQDNGTGFDRKTQTGSCFGLQGIVERARMVEGKTRISSTPGKGTRVRVRIPLTRTFPE
jgi:signal transduction histidine kinase